MARILVVDDDPDILKVTEKVLSASSHVVMTAGDAMKAMELLNTVPFDLLLSDANMPHYSGFDLVKTLRNDKRFHSMSIAMLTGLRERKDIDRAIKMGVDDYIVKPIDPLLFVKKVEALFKNKPPMEMPELKFPEGSELKHAALMVPGEVISMSELGMTLLSPHKTPNGMVIEINSPIFELIGISPPPVRVLSSEQREDDGKWQVKVTYMGATEAMLQKIRAWIFSKNSHRSRTSS
ncbi:MAG: response regulator transcription factor [Bdellovibrionaceae bacterium]|nr:response regulator transcription factor [Bdellovibrionales bacterium]MCB9084515.1 response regulator transcription factor [Pseudobdellovibrionaceae bacterium]